MTAHWQYFKYVLQHKWYVFYAGLWMGIPIWRLIFHDWTKFLPVEWGPYVAFFYGHGMTRGQAAALNYNFPVDDATELAFEYAWNHHQNHQDHHWQHWIRFGDDGSILALPMPDVCRREMLADWIGAGKALGKPKTWEWYEANKDKMKLHPETRAWIETELVEVRRSYELEQRLRGMGVIS
jgi:hypothetical protein